MIEIDLQDGDGAIVSVAQADPTVWANIAAQATQLATNAGFSLIVLDRVYNSPERTLDSTGAVQNWLAAQSNVGGAKRPSPTTGSDVALVVVGGVAATALLVAAVKLLD